MRRIALLAVWLLIAASVAGQEGPAPEPITLADFPKSPSAAMVAECAGEQGLFAPVSRLIYEHQRVWRRGADPVAAVTALATEAGADEGEIEACVSERRPMARLRAGIAAGRRLGVRGTPYFLVEGAPAPGAQPLEWWVRIFTAIEAEIESGAGDAS